METQFMSSEPLSPVSLHFPSISATSDRTQESKHSKNQFQSFSMMCAPVNAEEALPQRTPSGSLRRGRPQISLLDRRDRRIIGSGQVRPARPSLPTSDTEPAAQSRRTERQRPQPLLLPHLARSAETMQFEEVPYQQEAWESDVEWRRPASESTIPNQIDRSMQLHLLDQDHPTRVQSISSRERRSLSSPGVSRGRHSTPGRQLLQGQNANAMATTQPRNWDESAFRGNADYQLFVEATFGLTPELSRHSRSLSGSSSSPISPPDHFTNGAFEIAVPDEETLGPGDSITYRGFPSARQPFTFDIDDCQSGHVAGFAAHTASQLGPSHPRADDVLPNYAQSQAQVLQMARMASVSRAQELRRQWRLAYS